MGEKYLLDCTLRDGGYLNDWNFGHDNLVSIFERVVDAGLDFIEIGFLDQRRSFDINRSIMPNTDSVDKIFGHLNKKKTKVIGMIDFGTCDITNIKPAKECFLDGIRVIFKKDKKTPALQFCKKLVDLGYLVFAQLVSVTSYTDAEMMELIELANNVNPYAVSMVDTYGLLHQDNLMHYFELLDKHLNNNIAIGYHGHNNFQMGYANCIAMLSNNVNRDLLVDGSLYGMGKSAGNAPIELTAMHMNNKLGKHYDIYQLLEAIDNNISQFYKPSSWGYNLYFYLAASNDCHPNYVGYLMDKKTLSIKSINDILSHLSQEKKLLYDQEYVEKAYLLYQQNIINDDKTFEEIKKEFSGRDILLIGPGMSSKTQSNIISDYIKEKKPIILSLNHISKQTPDYVFVTNSKRYVQMATALSLQKHKIIATSNVTGVNTDSFDYILNYSNLIDQNTEIIDNSLAMTIRALIKIGCQEVSLAGFDGYYVSGPNYIDEIMEYDFMKQKYDYLNEYINSFIKDNKNTIKMKFITDTLYITY